MYNIYVFLVLVEISRSKENLETAVAYLQVLYAMNLFQPEVFSYIEGIFCVYMEFKFVLRVYKMSYHIKWNSLKEGHSNS